MCHTKDLVRRMMRCTQKAYEWFFPTAYFIITRRFVTMNHRPQRKTPEVRAKWVPTRAWHDEAWRWDSRKRDWGLWAAPHPGPHSHGGCPQQSQVWGYRPATWLVSGCARQCPLQSCGLLGKIKIGSIPHLALGLSTQSKAMWGKSKDMLFFSRDWQAHLVATIHSPRENAESHRHSKIQAETAK